MLVECPVCHLSFIIKDPHRPFQCPYCKAVLDLAPPDWKPRVLVFPEDWLGEI